MKKTKKKIKKKNKLVEQLGQYFKREPIDKPKRVQDVVKSFFTDCDDKTNLFKIKDDVYSMCIEYTDISFAKASDEDAETIFLQYVEYLNGFSPKIHIQIINNGVPIKTERFKKDFIYNTDSIENENIKEVASELNDMIDLAIGDKEQTKVVKRLIVLSTQAKSYHEAHTILYELYMKTSDKFEEIKSRVKIVKNKERLEFIYNILNADIVDDRNFGNIKEYAKEHDMTLYDILSPHKMSFREDTYISIDEGKKYISALYVSDLSTSLSPIFYNRLTTGLEDMSVLTTMNIQPEPTGKVIKKLNKKISAMKDERIMKKKKARKSNLDYEDVKDEKLEDRLKSTQSLLRAIQKKNQKIFSCNTLIVVSASSLAELEKTINKILEIGEENFVSIKYIKWQQLEGLKNALPLGHNSIQFQRTLHSEAVGVSVPFNSKDMLDKEGVFFGKNQISKIPIFCDRRKLINGNGCILGTSGGGKSFTNKLLIEQYYLKYPNDTIIIIDPQGEYKKIADAYGGQTIKISTTAQTHINPFDMDLNYDTDEPIKAKTEYIVAFMESIYGGLTGGMQSIIDRCTKSIYAPYEQSQYRDKTLLPTLPKFYDELKRQPEKEANALALVLERYIKGSLDIFSHETNVDINNRFIVFDITKLTESLRTTGYLVVLDYIKNKLAENKIKGYYTWVNIDEFHILLKNKFSSQYVAELYKTGRKFNAMMTILTQNIADILNNEDGIKMLANSEFAILLKQKKTDLAPICSIFEISNEEEKKLSEASGGKGVIVYDRDKFLFENKVEKDSFIYKLNDTSGIAQAR